MSRRYRQRRRADRQQETRQRIVQATMELHEEVGPAETTIRAIAERAGVQRLTVYRHFPDQHALISACSALHASIHPLPDFDRWSAIPGADARTRAALTEMYDYFANAEAMLEGIYRDVSRMPELAANVEGVMHEVRRGQEALVNAWAVDDARRPLLSAVIGHALAFQTWQSLVRQQGLDTADAVDVMVTLIRTVAADPNPTPE